LRGGRPTPCREGRNRRGRRSWELSRTYPTRDVLGVIVSAPGDRLQPYNPTGRRARIRALLSVPDGRIDDLLAGLPGDEEPLFLRRMSDVRAPTWVQKVAWCWLATRQPRSCRRRASAHPWPRVRGPAECPSTLSVAAAGSRRPRTNRAGWDGSCSPAPALSPSLEIASCVSPPWSK